MAVTVRVDVCRCAVLPGAQDTVGDAIAVGIEQAIVETPVPVEVNQRTAGVLGAIESEPAQLPAPIYGDRPRAGSVIGEEGLGSAVVVQVEHGVVGQPVAIEIGQGVVAHPVAVEIQADRLEPTVAIQVEVGMASPHSRCAVVTSEAIVHELSDAATALWVPACLPPGQQLLGGLLGAGIASLDRAVIW